MIKAVTKDGNTYFYFFNQLIYKAVTIKWFIYDKYYFEDENRNRLIEISILSFFGFFKKYRIISQKLAKEIILIKEKKYISLVIDDSLVKIEKKGGFFKFEGDFYIDNTIHGKFINNSTFFEKKFIFRFFENKYENVYFLILFSIIVIDKYNTGLSS